MEIKRLVIENFKSIERIELIEPNPFTVFVGPNGSGKSNIFEALEFWNLIHRFADTVSLFGGIDTFLNRKRNKEDFSFECNFDDFSIINGYTPPGAPQTVTYLGCYEAKVLDKETSTEHPAKELFYNNFTHLFVGNEDLVKLPLNDNQRLALDAKNLEKVLKRILSQEALRSEIFEWLELFVPEFKSVEVVANPFSNEETLLWHEQYAEKPFTKNLISDGTYNILALLTAVYQSKEPQFLCIEEPENGLNPKVVKELVNFCRYACEEFGHYIWLNTHSQTLVAQLTPNEIILVDKKNGATETKQIQNMNLHDLPMDEAWLSNALGGGIPW